MRVFGRRFSLVSLALPALLMLLLAACSTSTSDGGATATGTVAPSAQAREILAKAQAVKLKDATLKTVVTTKRGSQTVKLDGTARTTADPRRVEVVGTASGAVPYHAIMDGNVIYVKLNDKWLKYAIGSASTPSSTTISSRWSSISRILVSSGPRRSMACRPITCAARCRHR